MCRRECSEMPLVPADKYTHVKTAGGLSEDGAPSGKDESSDAFSSDDESKPDQKKRDCSSGNPHPPGWLLAAVTAAADAEDAAEAVADAAAASGATAAVPSADWAPPSATALPATSAKAAPAAASAAHPTNLPTGVRAAGSQLSLLQTQAQPDSLTPPSLAGAPARSMPVAAATGQAAAGAGSQTLQSAATHDVPTTFSAWLPAAGLLSTPGLLAVLPKPSGAPAGVPSQMLHSSEVAVPDAASAGAAAAPQPAARSRQPASQAHGEAAASLADQAAQVAVGGGVGGVGSSLLDKPTLQPPLGSVTALPTTEDPPQVQCSGLCRIQFCLGCLDFRLTLAYAVSKASTAV